MLFTSSFFNEPIDCPCIEGVLLVWNRYVSFIVDFSNWDPISVIASNLSGKCPCAYPFYLKNNSVLLLYLSLFLLHKQQKVITRIITNKENAITDINKTAWHFSQLAHPPSLQQNLHYTFGDLHIFSL